MSTILSRRSALLGAIASVGGTWTALAEDAQPPASTLPMTEQLEHSTVIIRCVNAKGEVSSGTGFAFALFRQNDQSMPIIVTNKHVVAGSITGKFRWTLKTADGAPDYGNFVDFDVPNFESVWIPHPDGQVDLAAFPCAPMFDSLAKSGKTIFVITIDQSFVPTEAELRELTPLEELLIVGYPDGISDVKNNVPVFRRGITATPAYLDFDGRKEFLIDAAIFPGSSGSPVFLYNQGAWADRHGHLALGGRLKLLGIVYGVALHNANGEIRVVPAPTQARVIAVSPIPNNLGICIDSSRILDFEPVFVKMGLRPPDGYVMRSGG
jgi:hypothetical protein